MCRCISMQWRGLDGDKADDTTGKAPGDPHEFRAELLESRTPCTVPRQCENTRITFPCCSSCWGGCPRQKGGHSSHLGGSRQLGRQWHGWKCQALLWERHWEFSKTKQNETVFQVFFPFSAPVSSEDGKGILKTF